MVYADFKKCDGRHILKKKVFTKQLYPDENYFDWYEGF